MPGLSSYMQETSKRQCRRGYFCSQRQAGPAYIISTTSIRIGQDDLASEIDAHDLICNFQHLALFLTTFPGFFEYSQHSINFKIHLTLSRLHQNSFGATRHKSRLSEQLCTICTQPTISACESVLIFRCLFSAPHPKANDPQGSVNTGEGAGLWLRNHVKQPATFRY